MTSLAAKQFDGFVSSISLDDTRKRRIEGALSNVNSWIANDPMSRIVVDDLFQQGSFAHQTVVRPLGADEEYDVDVVLPIDADLHRGGERSPAEILAYVKNCLARYPDYQGKVQQRRCCVRISFSGGFHVDVVPAHVTGDEDVPYQVVNRHINDWEPSNPSGYNDWFNSIGGGAGLFLLRPATKAFKRWRDLKFSARTAPRSIVLSTLLGQFNPTQAQQDELDFDLYYPDEPNLVTFVTDTANIMAANLCHLNGAPRIWNPSLPEGEEDLARHWDNEDFAVFATRLETLANNLDRAVNSRTKENATRRWQASFGDAFPGPLSARLRLW